MALRSSTPFVCRIWGDGSDASVTIDPLTDPVCLQLPGDAIALASLLSALPTGVANLSSTAGAISSYSYSLGVLTINFATAPAADTQYDVNGVFTY